MESSEVPEIAPILSGRQLRGKRSERELTPTSSKDSAVKVVPILDAPKQQKRSSSKDTSSGKSDSEDAASKRGPGRPAKKSNFVPVGLDRIKREPSLEVEKKKQFSSGLARNIVRKRKTTSAGPVLYSTKKIKQEKSGPSSKENKVESSRDSEGESNVKNKMGKDELITCDFESFH